jgi:hypothetical protein
MTGLGGIASLFDLPQRPRVFVSYHHRGDQLYYDLFSTWAHDTYQAIYDNSLERRIDSDDAEYVRRRLRENFITGTSCTVVLCWAETPQRKFVDWEIKATLDAYHGLVGIVLPTARQDYLGKTMIPNRLYANLASGYARMVHWNDLQSGGAGALRAAIAASTNASGAMIRNDAPLKTRNG